MGEALPRRSSCFPSFGSGWASGRWWTPPTPRCLCGSPGTAPRIRQPRWSSASAPLLSVDAGVAHAEPHRRDLGNKTPRQVRMAAGVLGGVCWDICATCGSLCSRTPTVACDSLELCSILARCRTAFIGWYDCTAVRLHGGTLV